MAVAERSCRHEALGSTVETLSGKTQGDRRFPFWWCWALPASL